jgi:hypothetical protein
MREFDVNRDEETCFSGNDWHTLGISESTDQTKRNRQH